MKENTEGRAEGYPISNQGGQTHGSFGKEFDIVEPVHEEVIGDPDEDPNRGDAELTNGMDESSDGAVSDPWMPIPRLKDLLEKLFPPRR